MVFAVKGSQQAWKYEIPKAWVQFRGFFDDLMEFPIIWASILRVTRNVNVKFTKEHKYGRIRVAILNPDIIPDLQFRVETETLPDPNPTRCHP
jgi:hypothetical protein